jgi:group I intron endonuclease
VVVSKLPRGCPLRTTMDPDTDSESECEYYRLARERVQAQEGSAGSGAQRTLSEVVGGVCANKTNTADAGKSFGIQRRHGSDSGDVQGSGTLTARKFPRKFIGCDQRTRRKRPSEQKGAYTEARYRAWDKANKKRQAEWKKKTHGIIYKLTSPSGKSYIGLSKHSIAHRLRNHLKKESKCVALKSALYKYGVESFQIEILHEHIPIEELPRLEQEEIANHSTLAPHGYNLTPGGEFNDLVLESSRQKVSDAKKKYWQNASDDDRKKANRNMMTAEAREKVAATKLIKTKKRLHERLRLVPLLQRKAFEEKFWADRKRVQRAYYAKRRASSK